MVARGGGAAGANQGSAALFETSVTAFLSDIECREEIFGASSVLVRCRSQADIRSVLELLEGQLTITLQLDDADRDDARALPPVIERRAGQIVVKG